MAAELADFWVGTYTADGDGTATGILSARREDAGTLRPSFAHSANSASWVTVHPSLGLVYATEEFTGRLLVLRPDGTRLDELGTLTLDAGACHLSVAPDGSAVIAACYGSGEVFWVPLRADGRFAGGATRAPMPTDPYGYSGADDTGIATFATPSGEKREPHAHQSRWLPNGLVLTTDLGFDLVRVWRPTAAGLAHVQDVSLPYGVGPRHTVWHESGHVYLITEYSSEVFTLRFDETGALRVIAAIRATADSLEDGDTGAEIAIGARRDRVYVGIRGSNRISTLDVRGDGSELRAISDVDCGGNWPRHHLPDGEFLHVCNQRSGTISTLRLDERTGTPAGVVGTVETGTPTCLAPARRAVSSS
ncbi:6-phosphogluconolactonase, cycloisomerase 2 family [Paramicrobacterium humi]|uniref:6-phosphogluconolactonase, cycloisomerase 2 family n=1 Tax=Paramicrobacterium humi TaxID=640635 RepID=A0A1H4MBB9_9MICO|nr:beta-propeller fold lactonase family protein [Microbacterium humi]SEB80233.1 6-phosphogluconolactonase, cycloisomerase 2 family [Microbacterium humi]